MPHLQIYILVITSLHQGPQTGNTFMGEKSETVVPAMVEIERKGERH